MQRVGLHHQATTLHAIEQLPQGLDLAAAVGDVGALSDRDAEVVRIQAHLGNEPGAAQEAFSEIEPRKVLLSHTILLAQ